MAVLHVFAQLLSTSGLKTSTLFCKDVSIKGICAPGTVCYSSVARLVRGPCRQLIIDKGNCSEACSKALNSYFKDNSELKTYLDTCDCGDDFSCITHRRRFSRCLHNNFTIPKKSSCTHQKARCLKQKNEDCKKLWIASFNKCQDLAYGYSCKDECRDARNELHKNRIGKKLSTCICDGTYRKEKYCLEIKHNVKKFNC